MAVLGFRYVVSFFFLCVSLLLGKCTADQFDRIVEGIVVRIYFNLCKNRGCGFEDSSAEKLSTDGVLQVVADVAFAHSGADRHRGCAVVGVHFAEFIHRHVDHADLRRIAVGDDNISAGSNEICDYFCGTFYGCFLFRQRRSKSFVSQCNNYFFSFHWKIPLFAVHRF